MLLGAFTVCSSISRLSGSSAISTRRDETLSARAREATSEISSEADILAEASRLAAAARDADARLRLLGGVAIAIRCPSAARPPLARSYGDIDVVARGSERRKLGRLLTSHGYRPLDQLNVVHGKSRLFYYDDERHRRLDVFLDRFEMCHDLDLRRRLELPGPTLPLADLLLTKLQVVQTNEKDLRDITAVLADHELTDDDAGVNVAYLTQLTGSDWGLWKTAQTVAERARRFAAEHDDLATAATRAERLLEAIEHAPKTRKWQARARIGERLRWYKLPEEPDFQ